MYFYLPCTLKLIYSSMRNTGKVPNPHKKSLQAELEASCCSYTVQMPKPTIKGVKSDFRVRSDSYICLPWKQMSLQNKTLAEVPEITLCLRAVGFSVEGRLKSLDLSCLIGFYLAGESKGIVGFLVYLFLLRNLIWKTEACSCLSPSLSEVVGSVSAPQS